MQSCWQGETVLAANIPGNARQRRIIIDGATQPKETSQITISPGSLRGAEGGISCPSNANSANDTKRV
jgi:hypothetical protein